MAASGFPSPAEDYEEGRIDLTRELIASPLSTFFMRVRGDAMRGDGIHDGDLLVIDRSVQPRSGCVVVAVFEGRFIVRRLCRDPNKPGDLRLEASPGDETAPIPLNRNDGPLNDGQGEGADLWGVVIHAVHHLVPKTQPRQGEAAPRRRATGRRGP